jgi:hypothetical protein
MEDINTSNNFDFHNLSGKVLDISSHIDNEIIKKLGEMESWKDGRIYFSCDANKNDFEILNTFFGKNKNVSFLCPENDCIPLLPEVEKFEFWSFDEDKGFNEKTIKLLKNNIVTTLAIRHGTKKAFDLTKLLVFNDTLKELTLHGGNYKNLEVTINEMNKLTRLNLESIKLDFEFIKENIIEHFVYKGSRTKEWEGLIKFSELRILFIQSNITLENLNILQGLGNLEQIILWNCSKIKKFPNFEKLKNLRRLICYDCKRLEDISEVKKLKNIETNLR